MKDKAAREKIERLEREVEGLRDIVEKLANKQGYKLRAWTFDGSLSVFDTEEAIERRCLPERTKSKLDALVDALGYEFEWVEAQPQRLIAKLKTDDKSRE